MHPVMTGRFERHPDGTRVHVTVRPHPAALVIMILWCGFWASALCMIVLAALLDQKGIAWSTMFLGVITGSAVFLIGWAILDGIFWLLVAAMRSRLTAVLCGTTIK
jgi:hypothetical protein